MQFVILAGGRGLRMRPDTDVLPKCLLPVAGRPFVDWQLAWLSREGVGRVVFSVGYLGDVVRRHVGDGRQFDMRIDYVEDGPDPVGTGGALRVAFDRQMLDEQFAVLYGDSYLPVRIADVEAAYRAQGAPVLMTVYRDPDGLETPNAVFEDGRVVRYAKGLTIRPAGMRYVDYGLSMWDRAVIPRLVPSGTVADLATAFEELSGCGQLAGWVATARFYEVGSRHGLRDFEAFLTRETGPDPAVEDEVRP